MALMQRKLAAILCADVVGYSGLMEADESDTLTRLKANRSEIFDPHVAAHAGRVFKLMGDGALVEFASVIAAVDCALAIQESTAQVELDLAESKRIRYRIGVNLGDVIVEDGDIYGDGVNVAARLQTIAPTGGVALSKTVRDHVEGKLSCAFEDLGEISVKNIERPIHVFTVRGTGIRPLDIHQIAEPRKLSICVLPFANMSDDPQQEYFSDGISEDIITDLSKISTLFVVSRNSAFTYRGKSVDVPRVARELKVSHVLEGSVRKAGGRVRITAQMIDAATNGHVWAERYDRDLNDIFAVQDEISQAIVKALKLKLLPAERIAIAQRGTSNVEAYNLFLMARKIYLSGNSGTSRGSEAVRRLCDGAIKIDPDYAQAWALMALAQVIQYSIFGGLKDHGLAAAERSIALDASLSEAHSAKARALTNLGDYDGASREVEIALRLDPDSYEANVGAGVLRRHQKRLGEAIQSFEKAATLNKAGYFNLGRLTTMYMEIGNVEAARRNAELVIASTELALAQEPDNGTAMAHRAYAFAILGERHHATALIGRGKLLDPANNQMKIYFVRTLVHLGEVEEALDTLDELLRTAGRFHLAMISMPHFDPLRSHPRFEVMIVGAETRLAATDAGSAGAT
jgi:adenylate cyclase